MRKKKTYASAPGPSKPSIPKVICLCGNKLTIAVKGGRTAEGNIKCKCGRSITLTFKSPAAKKPLLTCRPNGGRDGSGMMM